METDLKGPLENRKGTAQGLPFLHVAINMVPQDFLQQVTDEFIDDHPFRLVVDDYNASPARGPVHTNAVHDLFQTRFLRPVLLIINAVSNSPSHPPWSLLANQGGGPADWFAMLAQFNAAIDSIQAPPPSLTGLRLANGVFEFSFPGQRSRTNRVQSTTDFVNWSTHTNVIGTNATVTFRDPNALTGGRRFYRIVRP